MANLPKKPHEVLCFLLAGPLVLLVLTIMFGLFPGFAQDIIIDTAVLAIAGSDISIHLKLWHGVNTALMLSLLSLLVGVGLFLLWPLARKSAVRIWQMSRILGS